MRKGSSITCLKFTKTLSIHNTMKIFDSIQKKHRTSGRMVEVNPLVEPTVFPLVEW